MSEIAQVFTELFFGEGRWLGIILIFGFFLVLYKIKKEMSIPLFVIGILWGLEYLETVESSDPFFYAAITFMFFPIFLIIDWARSKG